MIVDFYFDYLSPYAYLAATEIPDLCARHGAELRLRPVLFAGLLDHWGQRGPAEIRPKAMHTIRDVLRRALLRGTTCSMPKHHPFNPLSALRVSLAEVAGDNQARVMNAIFEMGWARGGDLGNPDEIRAALDAANLDGAGLLGLAENTKSKRALRRETDEAIARGVFGVPTMIAGEEFFWGYDQLRFLELFLEGKDPLAGFDWDSSDFAGPSAWRRGISRHGE
ncbi:MAG: 2-hydroxychromene-2-carboxylate isomerase [Deltaproteobacteria bacterium]|nr:2-hydroxychromene-2-carboxylate isomerase [Deltaproteobacteria bacterium]